MEKGFNYARFYTLLKKLPGADKDTLVYCSTNGRTTSLREMTSKEYDEMCASMEEVTVWKTKIKKRRSLCLNLMQQLGIYTADWDRVNAFCKDTRIAGKAFIELNTEELKALADKLRTIQRKGGLKEKQDNNKPGIASCVFIDMRHATKR